MTLFTYERFTWLFRSPLIGHHKQELTLNTDIIEGLDSVTLSAGGGGGGGSAADGGYDCVGAEKPVWMGPWATGGGDWLFDFALLAQPSSTSKIFSNFDMSIKYYYIRIGLQTRDTFFGDINLGWHTSLANPRYHYTLRGYNHLGWMVVTIEMEAANQGMVYTYHPLDWNRWMVRSSGLGAKYFFQLGDHIEGDVQWIMHKHNDNYVLCCCAHVFHLKSTVAPERSQKTAISFNRHELWISLNCCLDLSNDSNYHRLKAVNQNLCSSVKNMSTRIGDFDLGSVQCLSSIFDRVPPTVDSGFRQTESPPDRACLEVTEYHYRRKDDVAEALGDLNMQGRDQTRGLGIAEELGALREGIGCIHYPQVVVSNLRLGDMPGSTNESWRVHLKKICVDVRFQLPQLHKSELPVLPLLDWLVPQRKETDKDYPHLNVLLLKEDEESNLNGLGYDESLQPLKPPSKARSCSTEISSLIPEQCPNWTSLKSTDSRKDMQMLPVQVGAGRGTGWGTGHGGGRTLGMELGGHWAWSWVDAGCGAGRMLGARWVLPW
ncbi:hypothetical protein IW261DRAFT_1416609 [Armillaria novae-zelandiae]|uniref:Uncharacterized protein n=1 Tax=Armillaria novae-zelandiae TaxID=153914 RepID=A0AA39PI66_9AGAR|nr:hypothetical protein IW261DRAFT_1416609 [Armillaria novae-zelandiae]